MGDGGDKVPTWDGEIEGWERYKVDVRYFLKTKPNWQKSQQLARLIRNLKRRAWDLIERLPEESKERLEADEQTFITFLKRHLLEGEIPELGRSFRSYLSFRRAAKESMQLYIMRHREQLSKLGKALKAVEGDELAKLLKLKTENIPGTGTPSETDEDDEEEDDRPSFASHPRRVWGSKSRNPTSPEQRFGGPIGVSAAAAAETSSQRSGSRRSDKESQRSGKWQSWKGWTDKDWEEWNQKHWKWGKQIDEITIPLTVKEQLIEKLIKVAGKLPRGGKDPDFGELIQLIAENWKEGPLPSLLSGWHLLQKSLLTPAERATIIAAASMHNNAGASNDEVSRMSALKLDKIEQALRTQWQDEELFARDDRKSGKEIRKPGQKGKSYAAEGYEESESGSEYQSEPDQNAHAASDQGTDSEAEFREGEAMLGELSDDDERSELEQALALMHDSKVKKKQAQRTFVQARAVVREIKKGRKFFRPRKANAAFPSRNSSNKLPKTPTSSRSQSKPRSHSQSTSKPTSSKTGKPEMKCFRCGGDHPIKDCSEPKPGTANLAEETAHMADSLEQELRALDRKRAELRRKIELKKELKELEDKKRQIERELYKKDRSRDRSRDRRRKEKEKVREREKTRDRDRTRGRSREKHRRTRRRSEERQTARSHDRDRQSSPESQSPTPDIKKPRTSQQAPVPPAAKVKKEQEPLRAVSSNQPHPQNPPSEEDEYEEEEEEEEERAQDDPSDSEPAPAEKKEESATREVTLKETSKMLPAKARPSIPVPQEKSQAGAEKRVELTPAPPNTPPPLKRESIPAFAPPAGPPPNTHVGPIPAWNQGKGKGKEEVKGKGKVDRARSEPQTDKGAEKGSWNRSQTEDWQGKGRGKGKPYVSPAAFYYQQRQKDKEKKKAEEKFPNVRCADRHAKLPWDIRCCRNFSPSPSPSRRLKTKPFRLDPEAFNAKMVLAEKRLTAKREKIEKEGLSPIRKQFRINNPPRTKEMIVYNGIWPSTEHRVEKLEVVSDDVFFKEWDKVRRRRATNRGSAVLCSEEDLELFENSYNAQVDHRPLPGEPPKSVGDKILENPRCRANELVGCLEDSEDEQENDHHGPNDDGYREEGDIQESRINIKEDPIKMETVNEPEGVKTETAIVPEPPEANAMEISNTDPAPSEAPDNLTTEIEGDFEPTPQVKEEKHPEAAMMSAEMAGTIAEQEPFLLIDTGATGNLVHSSWLERNEDALRAVVGINPQRRRSYRFASGSYAVCSSEATFSTCVGRVVFDVLESEHGLPPPPLLGMRFLRNVRANLCLLTNTLKLPQGKVLKLMQLQNGHLALKSADFFINNDL